MAHRTSGHDAGLLWRRWLPRIVLALVVVVVAVVAVLETRDSDGDHPGSEGGPSPVPVYGGTYVEGAIGRPTTLNPLLAVSQSERDLSRLLFRGLTMVGGDGAAMPDLAASWSVSDDGRTYTFRLRPDAVWHDGEAVGAQDVLFTVGLVQAADFGGDPAVARFWRGVTVATPDASTVVFSLHEPFAAFPNYAALPLVPRHLLGGVLARDLGRHPFSSGPIGTGPFRFDHTDPESGDIVLQPFEQFYGGRPYLDSFVFRYYDDPDSLLQALTDQDIDGSGALSPARALGEGAAGDERAIYSPTIEGFTALFFNTRDPLFTSADVRRAIGLLLNREQLVQRALEQQAVPGASPIPSASWAYVEQPLNVDVQQATELLAKAGWSDSDGDGVLETGGRRFAFPLLVNADDPQRAAAASEVAAQLQSVGIQVTVQPLSTADVSQALATRQYTAAVFGWHAATGDPDCFQLWHSSGADSGLNFTGLRDAKVDDLLQQARAASDRDERGRLYAEFQRRFLDVAPAVVLYYPRYFFVVSDAISGIDAQALVDPSDRLQTANTWFRIDITGRPVETMAGAE